MLEIEVIVLKIKCGNTRDLVAGLAVTISNKPTALGFRRGSSGTSTFGISSTLIISSEFLSSTKSFDCNIFCILSTLQFSFIIWLLVLILRGFFCLMKVSGLSSSKKS
eukprot:NODE_321_length_9805_cov_0.700185.p10 type:complete len:108 gc:universal NODE_321_length_9805_cov_0.700185:432-109(-)